MLRRTTSYFAALMTLALFVVILGSPAQSQDEITVRLNWLPESQGELAAYYLADHLGYYEENNLDVTIEKGTGSGDAVRLASVKRADIAIADLPTILVGIGDDNLDLTILAALYQRTPFTTWARRDHGIEEPQDLAGKTVGAPEGDAQRIMWGVFEDATGLEPDSVRWVGVSPGSEISTQGSGQVDASTFYLNSRYLYEQSHDEGELIAFPWHEYGVDMYGNAMFTHSDMIEENPEVVARFMDAALRGYQWLFNNPEEGLQILREYVPEAEPDKLIHFLEEERPLFVSDVTREHGLGWIDRERMQTTVDLVEEHFDIERSINVDEVYTNEFNPGHNWTPNDEGGDS